MLKPFISCVRCDKEGKLITVDNCPNCEYYVNGDWGIVDGIIECRFDKVKYNKEAQKQYKEFYNKNIEFGTDEE